MSATGLPRVRERLLPPAPRRGGGLTREGAVSLTLHALVIALIIAGVARRRMNDRPAPGTVAVVFEGGQAASEAPAAPARQSTPAAPPEVRQTEQAPPGAAPPAARAAPPSAPASSPAPPLRAAPQTAPAAPSGTAAAPLPPPAPPRARAHPARPPSPAPFASLSAPMQFSLQGHPPPPASVGKHARGIELALAPTAQNRNVMTRYAEARHKLGEDWWAAFSRFVDEHKYYPLSAAERGEDGQSVLRLVIARDGTVLSVKVELSSGSPLLDAAWISEFRGAKVPAFPPGTEENEITFSASMTYILENLQ